MLLAMLPAPTKAMWVCPRNRPLSRFTSGRKQSPSIHAGQSQNHLSRGPKIAVPMRTMVAPSAMAASRSLDIPMDRVSIRGQLTQAFQLLRKRAKACALLRGSASWWRGWPSVRAGAGGEERVRCRASSGSSPRNDAGFAGLTGDVHLQADLQRWQVIRPLFAQAPGDLDPVHAVHPVEMTRDGPGFVGLDRADEVPDQVRSSACGHFLQGFLQVALTEIPQAAGIGARRMSSAGRVLLTARISMSLSKFVRFLCALSRTLWRSFAILSAKMLLSVHAANVSRFGTGEEATSE